MKKYRRKCDMCGEDISDHPSNHTLCDDCYRIAHSGLDDSFGSHHGTATDKQVRLLLQLKDEGYVGEDVYFKSFIDIRSIKTHRQGFNQKKQVLIRRGLAKMICCQPKVAGFTLS
jgi:hypothetical protein